MPKLIRFLLLNAAGGFSAGLGVGCAFVQATALSDSAGTDPLAIMLVLWGFGSSFALGAVATGLALLPYD